MSAAMGSFDENDNDYLLNDWRPPKKTKGKNRRKGPDFWVRALTFVSIGGWGLLVLAVFMFDAARPETETFFHRFFEAAPKLGWNTGLQKAVYGLVFLCQALSVAGIVANSRRMRRKTDKFRWSIVGLALASAGVGATLYLFNK